MDLLSVSSFFETCLGLLSILGLILLFLLPIILVVALIRWLWRKGSK